MVLRCRTPHLCVVPLHHPDDITSGRYAYIEAGKIVFGMRSIPEVARATLDEHARLVKVEWPVFKSDAAQHHDAADKRRTPVFLSKSRIAPLAADRENRYAEADGPEYPRAPETLS